MYWVVVRVKSAAEKLGMYISTSQSMCFLRLVESSSALWLLARRVLRMLQKALNRCSTHLAMLFFRSISDFTFRTLRLSRKATTSLATPSKSFWVSGTPRKPATCSTEMRLPCQVGSRSAFTFM